MRRELAKKAQGWRCPRCGRRFRQRTREHSCDVRSLAAHLDRASDEVKNTFEKLQHALARLGPHAVVPVKTMILLRGSANFGAIVVRQDSLDLELVSSHPHADPRIRKTDRLGPQKFTHHIRLSSAAEIDAQILSWLKEAYRIGVRGEPKSSSD